MNLIVGLLHRMNGWTSWSVNSSYTKDFSDFHVCSYCVVRSIFVTLTVLRYARNLCIIKCGWKLVRLHVYMFSCSD